MTMTDAELARYAQAVIGDCLGTQPGDLVAVHGEPAHAPARARRSSTRPTAPAPATSTSCTSTRAAKRSRIQHAEAETLGGMPAWHDQRMRALLAADASIISITGESTPGLLGGLDPARAALERTSRLPGQRIYLRAIELGRARFCVVAWPVPGWASPAYPELEPDAATRARRRRPAGVLPARARRPAGRLGAAPGGADGARRGADALGARPRRDPRRRHVARPRARAGHALGGGARARPHGPHVLREPADRGGLHEPGRRARRRHLRLHAAAGPGRPPHHRHPRRAPAAASWSRIDADAPEDRDFLWSYFQRDRGASRLGELALVDSTSRIGQKGRTYGLTLLDENAVSHIAFGSGFAGARAPDPSQRGARGVNRSAIHVDVMIGAPEQDVTGVREDGARVPLIAAGPGSDFP